MDAGDRCLIRMDVEVSNGMVNQLSNAISIQNLESLCMCSRTVAGSSSSNMAANCDSSAELLQFYWSQLIIDWQCNGIRLA